MRMNVTASAIQVGGRPDIGSVRPLWGWARLRRHWALQAAIRTNAFRRGRQHDPPSPPVSRLTLLTELWFWWTAWCA
jgi:hypothetical protein